MVGSLQVQAAAREGKGKGSALITGAVAAAVQALIQGMAQLFQGCQDKRLEVFGFAGPVAVDVDPLSAGVADGGVGGKQPPQLFTAAQFHLQAKAHACRQGLLEGRQLLLKGVGGGARGAEHLAQQVGKIGLGGPVGQQPARLRQSGLQLGWRALSDQVELTKGHPQVAGGKQLPRFALSLPCSAQHGAEVMADFLQQ